MVIIDDHENLQNPLEASGISITFVSRDKVIHHTMVCLAYQLHLHQPATHQQQELAATPHHIPTSTQHFHPASLGKSR